MHFKEFVFATTAVDFKSLIDATNKAEQYLLNVLSSNLLEGAYHLQREVKDIFLSNRKFLDWVKNKFNAQPIKQGGWLVVDCGTDSCACFFTNNIVVKFLGGKSDHKEFAIAKAIKGKLKIAPVLDTLEINFNDTSYYVVVMKKLDTDFYHLSSNVKYASHIVAYNLHNLQVLVEKNPKVPIEYIRRRLTLKYMLKNEERNQELIDAMKDLVRMIRVIHKTSGYLVGADFEGRNIGLSDTGRVQSFDFGRADKHELMHNQIPKTDHEIMDL